jgi:hypothetical protein
MLAERFLAVKHGRAPPQEVGAAVFQGTGDKGAPRRRPSRAIGMSPNRSSGSIASMLIGPLNSPRAVTSGSAGRLAPRGLGRLSARGPVLIMVWRYRVY